jgi:hypothetical protein
MNESQQVFVVFYAIFWGAIANVQPRWKPFQVPLIFSKWSFGRKVLMRVFLSFLFFNLAPLIFFGWTILFLFGPPACPQDWNVNFVGRLAIRGIVPAFALFSFYHFWLAFVEFKGECFYAKDQDELPPECKRVDNGSHVIDPTIKELGINRSNWWKNLICALVYLVIAIFVPRIFS